MNDDLERTRKEAVVAQLRCYVFICLEALTKASFRIDIVLGEIPIRHMPTEFLERYQYANLIGAYIPHWPASSFNTDANTSHCTLSSNVSPCILCGFAI
jgi:hypothetical protein